MIVARCENARCQIDAVLSNPTFGTLPDGWIELTLYSPKVRSTLHVCSFACGIMLLNDLAQAGATLRAEMAGDDARR